MLMQHLIKSTQLLQTIFLFPLKSFCLLCCACLFSFLSLFFLIPAPFRLRVLENRDELKKVILDILTPCSLCSLLGLVC